jgi:outer membrane protein assembly factor BamC
MRLLALLCASALLLGGCSGVTEWAEGKDKVAYKTSSTLPPLEVPPDLTSPSRDNRYQIPEPRSSATLSGYEAERRDTRGQAVATGVLPQFDRMHVERAGGQRWLVVDEPVEKLWPVVKDFWQENGFLIKVEAPELGVLETEWAENRARIPQSGIRALIGKAIDQLYSTSERDKYRTRLERTPDGKGSEVYISHRGMVEVYTSAQTNTNAGETTKWQPRDPDPQLEAEFLHRLMVRLGAQDEKARTQLAAATSEQRAEIRKGLDGGELLQVYEPFDRVWRRVGLALDRVGFTVEDRDRQKGLYFVRYADPEAAEPPGFFGRVFGSAAKVKAEQFRVQVTQSGTASEVNVLNKDGAADTSRTAQRILALLHEQLK